MRRLPIGFDAETFDDINSIAEARGISFSERVRELVEIGRETEKQESEGSCSRNSGQYLSRPTSRRSRRGRATG